MSSNEIPVEPSVTETHREFYFVDKEGNIVHRKPGEDTIEEIGIVSQDNTSNEVKTLLENALNYRPSGPNSDILIFAVHDGRNIPFLVDENVQKTITEVLKKFSEGVFNNR